MSDPIGGLRIKSGLNEFRKETVEDYLKKRDSFGLYPLRHYSQLELDFDPDLVKKLLNRLKIPTPETKVTVFGGYTGQFASCLCMHACEKSSETRKERVNLLRQL